MSGTAQRSKARGRPARAAVMVDVQEWGSAELTRFQQRNFGAGKKVAFMIQRGAMLLQVNERDVHISHSGRAARIDARGRVDWNAAVEI